MKLIPISKNKFKLLRWIIPILLFGMMSVIIVSCGAYSFTGSSVPSHLKTIYIPVSQDKSPAAIPGLRELLTDNLIQKFINDNSLQVSNATSANSSLDCVITSVTDVPSIVSAGEQITSRKLTINVKVVYKDLVMKKTVFDKNFSGYGDYEPAQSTNKRENAIEIAVNNISEDILLAVVSGW